MMDNSNHFLRMTIRDGMVFKLKTFWSGYCTDMACRKVSWGISAAARPLFRGSRDECLAYISANGAMFQEA